MFEEHPDVVRELQGLGREGAQRPLPAGDDALQGLYALSRVTDLLIEPHQPTADVTWHGHQGWPERSGASMASWKQFIAVIGASEIAEDRFHPFFHEIVDVEPAGDPDEPATIVSPYWPGAMVGNMLLVRAGVRVRAGSAVMDPTVAAHSPLYFAWRRRNRPTHDLSHGWGSSSQWRTDFRRDYIVGDEFHYNVDSNGSSWDGETLADDGELSDRERIELVRFRHGLTRDLGMNRWPFDDYLIEQRPT